MALQLFGVNASFVRRHFYPNAGDFSPTSSPTDATVAEEIDSAAGELAGRLLKQEITPADITALGATSPPYVICRKVIAKIVAVEVFPAMSGQDAQLLTRWQAELDAFWDRLEDAPEAALGDDGLSDSASEPEGPTTHLDELNIDVGDPATDASDAIPMFRKDDET